MLDGAVQEANNKLKQVQTDLKLAKKQRQAAIKAEYEASEELASVCDKKKGMKKLALSCVIPIVQEMVKKESFWVHKFVDDAGLKMIASKCYIHCLNHPELEEGDIPENMDAFPLIYGHIIKHTVSTQRQNLQTACRNLARGKCHLNLCPSQPLFLPSSLDLGPERPVRHSC